MQAFFASGHAIDLVLLVLLAEGLLLWRRGRAAPASIALALLPGALVLIGARAALTGAAWPAVAVPLLLSLPIHLADIRRRQW